MKLFTVLLVCVRDVNNIRPLQSLIGSKLGWIRFFYYKYEIWQKAIPETEMDSLFSQRQKKTSKKKGGRTPKSRIILAESRFPQLCAPSK